METRYVLMEQGYVLTEFERRDEASEFKQLMRLWHPEKVYTLVTEVY